MENQNNKQESRLVSALKSITDKSCLFVICLLVTVYVLVFSSTLSIRRDAGPIQAALSKGDQMRKVQARSQLNATEDTTDGCFVKDKLIQEIRSSTQDATDGCYLKNKLQAPHLPDLHSVFADHTSGQVVFVGLKLLKQAWHRVQFRCEFPSGNISAVHAVDDRRSFGHMPQYVVVLTCPIPNTYHSRSSFIVTLRRLPGNNAYRNIQVCATSNEKHFLAMCTMVKSVDQFIPQWLDYHRYLGVQHVYIYDNDKPEQSTLETTLKNYIKDGFATLVPWAHSTSVNKTYLEVQIAHENDCVWRHKHDVNWMIKIDVDEYIQPMDTHRPRISDYLSDTLYNNVAALRIQNWFFGHPPRIAPRGDTVIERNRWRAENPTLQNTGHDKNILRPINVHYYKIHSVKLGGDVMSADPYTELRLVHYRTDNRRARHFDLPKFKERDESMVRIRRALVNHRLQGNTNYKIAH